MKTKLEFTYILFHVMLCYDMSLCARCRFDMFWTLGDDFLYVFIKSSRLHETKLEFTYILCNVMFVMPCRYVPH